MSSSSLFQHGASKMLAGLLAGYAPPPATNIISSNVLFEKYVVLLIHKLVVFVVNNLMYLLYSCVVIIKVHLFVNL
jgi:hypothetical protein